LHPLTRENGARAIRIAQRSGRGQQVPVRLTGSSPRVVNPSLLFGRQMRRAPFSHLTVMENAFGKPSVHLLECRPAPRKEREQASELRVTGLLREDS